MRLLNLFKRYDVEKLKERGDVKGLVEALGNSRDKIVIDKAIDALVEIGSSVVPDLIACINDKDETASQNSRIALRKLDLKALDQLILMLGDEDQNVRDISSRALVEIGSSAIPSLLSCLNHPNDNVRVKLSLALTEILEPKKTEGIIDNSRNNLIQLSCIDPFIACLKDKNATVRQNAAYILYYYGDERAVEPLIEALNDESALVKRNVTWALARIADNSTIDAFIVCLKDRDNIVRQNAAWGLARIANDRAINAFIICLKDNFEKVRQNAAWGLGRINNPSAIDPLMESLKDRNPQVRFNAAEALGQIGDIRALNNLLKLIDDEDKNVSDAAKKSIISFGSKAMPPLIQILNTRTGDLYNDYKSIPKATMILGEIGNTNVVIPLLVHCLHKMSSSFYSSEIENNANIALVNIVSRDLEARNLLIRALGYTQKEIDSTLHEFLFGDSIFELHFKS